MIERLQQKRNEGGFTLIELLIVIIVLGILAAIVVFAVGTTRDDAAKNACKTEVKAVQLSAESVKVHDGSYPTTANASYLADPSHGGLLKAASSTTTYTSDGTTYTITPSPTVTGCSAVTG